MDWYKEWIDLTEDHMKIVQVVGELQKECRYWMELCVKYSKEVERLRKLCEENKIVWQKNVGYDTEDRPSETYVVPIYDL